MKNSSEMGIILPHGHVIVDLRLWNTQHLARPKVEDVFRLIKPELE